jgi:hypothetical protein
VRGDKMWDVWKTQGSIGRDSQAILLKQLMDRFLVGVCVVVSRICGLSPLLPAALNQSVMLITSVFWVGWETGTVKSKALEGRSRGRDQSPKENSQDNHIDVIAISPSHLSLPLLFSLWFRFFLFLIFSFSLCLLLSVSLFLLSFSLCQVCAFFLKTGDLCNQRQSCWQ